MAQAEQRTVHGRSTRTVSAGSFSTHSPSARQVNVGMARQLENFERYRRQAVEMSRRSTNFCSVFPDGVIDGGCQDIEKNQMRVVDRQDEKTPLLPCVKIAYFRLTGPRFREEPARSRGPSDHAKTRQIESCRPTYGGARPCRRESRLKLARLVPPPGACICRSASAECRSCNNPTRGSHSARPAGLSTLRPSPDRPRSDTTERTTLRAARPQQVSLKRRRVAAGQRHFARENPSARPTNRPSTKRLVK